ncbi:MAG: DUF1616 domain-containing protein [Thermoplasmata archaeon]|nr:DUF1616 domain-containing protein [Thermoplasmata archaeon]
MNSSQINDMLGSKDHPMDLLLVIVLTILSVVAVISLPDGNILRIVLGIPLLIFFPGYATVSILWPGDPGIDPIVDTSEDPGIIKKERKSIDNLERLALSFGLSLAIVPLIGIILNFIWDISFISIVTSIFIFIFITSGLAWYRRTQLPTVERYSISFKPSIAKEFKEWTQVDKTLTIVLVLALIISFMALAYVITSDPNNEPFTEFYIMDQNHTIEDLPTNLTMNQTGTMIIGIKCNEYETTRYSIVIHLTNATGERQNRTVYNYDVVLEHEGLDEALYPFQISATGEYRMTIELFKDQQQSIYLENHIWITVS